MNYEHPSEQPSILDVLISNAGRLGGRPRSLTYTSETRPTSIQPEQEVTGRHYRNIEGTNIYVLE